MSSNKKIKDEEIIYYYLCVPVKGQMNSNKKIKDEEIIYYYLYAPVKGHIVVKFV